MPTPSYRPFKCAVIDGKVGHCGAIMDSSGCLIRRLKANRHARELADQEQGFDYGPNQSGDRLCGPVQATGSPSIAIRKRPGV